MKIKINIECEDFDEILQHLEVIRNSVKVRRVEIESLDDVTLTLSDSNCYGEHIVKIKI